MGSRYELLIWFLTLTVVIEGTWGQLSTSGKVKLEADVPSYIKRDIPCPSLKEILVLPVSERSRVISILKKELNGSKLFLLKQIEIKDKEVYAILYNDVLCRLGNFENLDKKLDLILKIIETANKQGIDLKEIDVRSLKFPTINRKGETENNEQ